MMAAVAFPKNERRVCAGRACASSSGCGGISSMAGVGVFPRARTAEGLKKNNLGVIPASRVFPSISFSNSRFCEARPWSAGSNCGGSGTTRCSLSPSTSQDLGPVETAFWNRFGSRPVNAVHPRLFGSLSAGLATECNRTPFIAFLRNARTVNCAAFSSASPSCSPVRWVGSER